MNEQIEAYRIDNSLFCPECYKKGKESLPEGSGVTLPGEPLEKGEIGIYICKQCKSIKGPWPAEMLKVMGGKQITPRTHLLTSRVDLLDKLDHTRHKLLFLEVGIVDISRSNEGRLSDDVIFGLQLLFDDITADIKVIFETLCSEGTDY